MFTFRPAKQENTPLIIGLAGPTKSGKTYSALRLATGLANGGQVVMINAEGPRGRQYAGEFKYLDCDIDPPHTFERYTEALEAAAKLNPAVLIIDSASHMHDGPGGMLEQHDNEVDRRAGNDFAKRDRVNMAAWIKPKKAENHFIYRLLDMRCHVILCFRAKEKAQVVKGKDPVFRWEPIASDRIAFETIFTLMFLPPPHPRGIPSADFSEMRKPFDTIVKMDQVIDEELGKRLRSWASGTTQDGAVSDLPKDAVGYNVYKNGEKIQEVRFAMPETKVADWLAVFDSCTTVEMAQKQLKLAYESCQTHKDRPAAERIKAAYDKCIARLGG